MNQPSQETAERVTVKDFIAKATSPAAWISNAEWLVGSSELLWERIAGHFESSQVQSGPTRSDSADASHGPAYLLLFGFALEAMLKAAALQVELNTGGIERVLILGATPRVRPWLKTHRLDAIAARAAAHYGDEERLYLRRFERHLMWAGRYPVSLSPELGSRGFDYQLGAQDRTVGHSLLKIAREAYDRAKSVPGAWAELDGVGDYRVREAEWVAATTAWLRAVRPSLVQHAIRMAQGERGVMQLSIDTSEMRSHIAGSTARFLLEPTWLPMSEFISAMSRQDGVGSDSARRWADALAQMNPLQDAAIVLCSEPDADGRWFSRYLFLKASVAP